MGGITEHSTSAAKHLSSSLPCQRVYVEALTGQDDVIGNLPTCAQEGQEGYISICQPPG